jgi:hypothetical protein
MGISARTLLCVFQFYLEIDLRGYVSRLSPRRAIQFVSKIESADALIIGPQL